MDIRINKKIYIGILSTIVIMVGLAIMAAVKSFQTPAPDKNLMAQAEAVEPYNPAGQINKIKVSVPAQEGVAATSTKEIELPILMYHHIRDFHNPKDPVGEKLSVSPKNFAAQLDEIVRLGYETITFKDLAAGHIPARPIILTFDDGYKDIYEKAYPEMIKRKMKGVAFIITGYIGAPVYMTAGEIKNMAMNNIEIGSHTISHPGLALLNANKQHHEIFDSKTSLEKLLGFPIISFCYPYGNYNNITVKYTEESGYKYAVTTKTGEGDTLSPFFMKRVRVPDEGNISGLLRRIQKVEPAKP